MPAFNKFNDFALQLGKAVHNFSTHSFKVALTNVAPVATDTVLANITQIAAGNGYAAGGFAVPNVGIVGSGADAIIDGDKVTITAAGGSMAAFRYAVLYNDTAASPADALVGWWDYGSSITLATGESLDFKPSNVDANGTLLTITVA